MAMIVKEEHVTVVFMEACVTLGNFVKQNFNFVRMKFFMRGVLNVNQDRDHRHIDSPTKTVRLLIPK